MFRPDPDEAFRLAAEETRRRIREDRKRYPRRFALFFSETEQRLFTYEFDAKEARGVTRGRIPPLDKPLAAYLDDYRIATAQRMIQLGDGLIPTGCAAAAVGLASYSTWRRTFERSTGEKPPLFRLPVWIAPKFDELSWHQAWRGELSRKNARRLVGRLCRRYPGAPDGTLPPARFLCPDDAVPIAIHWGSGISLTEAEEARDRAGEKPIEWLLATARDLKQRAKSSSQRNLAKILKDLAEHLFSPDLKLGKRRERLGVRDTSITTKSRFFLGDTLGDILDKLRTETALPLVADPRFDIDPIAEVLGLSYRRFNAIFRKRTGTTPKEIRNTLEETSGHPARDLWLRAESGDLSHAEVRILGGYLRGLHPGVLEHVGPAILAVRGDVEPGRVEAIVEIREAMPANMSAVAKLDQMIRTHQGYSADDWYVHWVRDRLGRPTLDSAWAEWMMANRTLAGLLELPPEDRLKRVREDETCQSDAFLWLLVDCVSVRLFHDAAESEHFADLAVAASEARWLRDPGPASAGLLALALAFKANALRRRNELSQAAERFEEVFGILEARKVDPWSTGLAYSLFASYLDRRGETHAMLEALVQSARYFGRAKDLLEWLRCLVKTCTTWICLGTDPSLFLTVAIRMLESNFLFASDLIESAHVNRLFGRIYLGDQLTGKCLPEIRRFRAEVPATSALYTSTNYLQIDGLIAALGGDSVRAAEMLRAAASKYEEQDLLAEAAVAWLQHAWAMLENDASEAGRMATIAIHYMERSGFDSHRSRAAARQILSEAEQKTLTQETLRAGIIVTVCPKARLIERPAGGSMS